MLSRCKSALPYAMLLLIGLGIGYLFSLGKAWLKSPYVEGNYAAHFTDPAKRAVMYGTKTCPYCIQAREYLEAKHIEYVDIDVESTANTNEKANFVRLQSDGVPVIIIGNRLMMGFYPSAIDDAFTALQVSNVKHVVAQDEGLTR